jgi:SnoaL-like domain
MGVIPHSAFRRLGSDCPVHLRGLRRNFQNRNTIMPDIIETLLLRNLQEVFGEGDPTRRRAAIENLYTEDCTVLLPIGRYVGHAALDQVAGELRTSHPSFVYTPHRPPQAVQDGGRLAWGSGPAGEPPRYTGLDVIIVLNGKIAALYVFLDSPPA